MRARASRARASRSPKAVAPVGHTAAHAVGCPAATRGAHSTHLPTTGTARSHWYLGTPNGQAMMQ